MPNKKAEFTSGILSFGNSAILLLRPVAFCPVITDGLALSGYVLSYQLV
jgi:hypothetical protein